MSPSMYPRAACGRSAIALSASLVIAAALCALECDGQHPRDEVTGFLHSLVADEGTVPLVVPRVPRKSAALRASLKNPEQ